jgi:hypothetical protein
MGRPEAERAGSERVNLSLFNQMTEERKTLEQRAQMTDTERLRQSAAHVLATAILCHSERSRGISRY